MNPITIMEGRLTADPELRFAPSGTAVCNLTIVTSDRKKNGETWEDVDTTFWRCAAFGQMAENIAESLTRGMQVVAQVKLSQRSYETREGEKRTVVEGKIMQIGPALQFATAKVNRPERGSNSAASGGAPGTDPNPPSGPPAADPFSSEPPY